MNIFLLDKDPQIAAQSLCDKHIVSQLVESALILSTAIRVNLELVGGEQPPHIFDSPLGLYHKTHENNRIVKQITSSQKKFRWLFSHASEIERQYRLRYCREMLNAPLVIFNSISWVNLIPTLEDSLGWYEAMPLAMKRWDEVQAYREYYIVEKARFAKWNRGVSPPFWWPNTCNTSTSR